MCALLACTGFSLSDTTSAGADTLYLKNGRAVEGFINNESGQSVELDVGFGTVTFQKAEIDRVYKSTLLESARIRKKWEESKASAEYAKPTSPRQPRKIEFQQNQDRIVVEAVLNGNVKASLLLDTGASFVVLTAGVSRALGIDTDKETKIVELQMADGRKVNAKFVLLKSIAVEDIVAENIEAAVMTDDTQDPNLKDGVLGMSFLKRFNFKVDYTNGRVIFEKI